MGRVIAFGPKKGYTDVTTRMPAPILADLKFRLAPRFGGTLTAMFETMLTQFLAEKPWERGLPWRKTQALSRREVVTETVKTGDGQPLVKRTTRTVATGWVQVNMRLPLELAERIKSVAANHDTSPSTVLYTSVFWWIWYKNPTPEILRKRQADRARLNAQRAAEQYRQSA
jgi:hypothetical protein